MELHYTITVDDQLARLARYVSNAPHMAWMPRAAYAVIVLMSWLSAWLFYVRQGHASRGYLAYGALAALLTLTLPMLYRRYQDSFFRSVLTAEALRGAIGPATLTVHADRVEQRTGLTAVGGRWSDVTGIEVGAHHTFIMFAPMLAALIPAAAFPDAEARSVFESTLFAQWEPHRLAETARAATHARGV
jgi:hypothetical protein